MAQSTARKHEHEQAAPQAAPEAAPEVTTPVLPPADTLVVKTEDGEGHGYFVPVDMSAFRAAIAGLPANFQSVALSGVKYECTRALQSKAKQLRRDKVADVLGGLVEHAKTIVASLDPDIERFDTIGTMRVDEAKALTAEKIKAKTGKEASEADVAATLKIAYERYSAEIDSRLLSKLAAGYTPTARKSGGKTEASGSVVEI